MGYAEERMRKVSTATREFNWDGFVVCDTIGHVHHFCIKHVGCADYEPLRNDEAQTLDNHGRNSNGTNMQLIRALPLTAVCNFLLHLLLELS